MTFCTKPEVHNVSLWHRRRTEPWLWTTCTKNLVKIAHVVPKIFSQIDRCTHTQRDVLITILCNRSHEWSNDASVRSRVVHEVRMKPGHCFGQCFDRVGRVTGRTSAGKNIFGCSSPNILFWNKWRKKNQVESSNTGYVEYCHVKWRSVGR